MPDYWSVPIVPVVFTDLNDQIAKGGDYSWLGKLPDSYWAGQNQQYTQAQRDVFKNGLPRDNQGNIDWNAAAEQLAKVGGTSQVQNVMGLSTIEPTLKAISGANPDNNPAPAVPVNPQYPPSVAAPPAQAAKQPAPITGPVPGGQPVPPGQSINLTGPDRTSIVQGTGEATPRMLAQRLGVDASQLAQNLGVGQDEVIDTTDPNVRAKIVQFAQGGQQPQAPAANFNDRFQPQGYGVNTDTADAYEAKARILYQKADQIASGSVPLGVSPLGKVASENMAKRADMLRKQADQFMTQANTIRQGLVKNAEITPEQKNATASGQPNPQAYTTAVNAQNELAKKDIETFQTRYTGLQTLGEQSYNGIQKAQLMKQLTLDPSFYSGPLSEYSQTYNQFRSVFGAAPTSALPQEAFNKVVNDLLTEQVKAMGQSGVGRVLQSEVNIMRNGIASLGITPASNRALAEIVSRVYKQQQDIAEIARHVPQSPGKMNQSLDSAVTSYLRQHPLFTQEELQNPKLLSAPDAPPQSAQWSPQQARQWAQSIGLKPGEPIRMNGKIMAVP